MSARSVFNNLFFLLFLFSTSLSAQGVEDSSLKFSGRVVDENGKGISGATLFLYETVISSDFSGIDRNLKARTQSETDGSFSFSVNKEHGKLFTGVILGLSNGKSLGWVNWDLKHDITGEIITLGRYESIKGVVVNRQGEFVKGAKVRSILTSKSEGWSDLFDHLVSTTDAKGAFEIPLLPVNCRVSFQVEAEGYADTFSTDKRVAEGPGYKPGQDGIRIELAAECIISGQVIEASTMEPLGGINLYYTSDSRTLSNSSFSIISDKDGFFKIKGIGEGTYEVALNDDAESSADFFGDKVNVTLKAGELKSGVLFKVRKVSGLIVTVKDKKTGAPIDDANVYIGTSKNFLDDPDSYAESKYASTNTFGTVRLKISPGEYYLGDVSAEGYRAISNEKKILVTDGKIASVAVELEELPKVSGVVKDVFGNPVAGASVRMANNYRKAITNSAGRFGIYYESDLRFSKLRILARKPESNLIGYQEYEFTDKSLAITMRNGVKLSGKVVSFDGSVPKSCRVGMYLAAGEKNSVRFDESVLADSDGRYEIGCVLPGQIYEISGSSKGFYKEIEIEVPLGATGIISSGTMKLGSEEVWGSVVDQDGVGVEGAEVEVYDVRLYQKGFPFGIEVQPCGKGISGSDGDYRFDKIKQSWNPQYSFITARKKGYSSVSIRESEKEGFYFNNAIMYDNPSIIAGRVVTDDDEGVSGATVRIVFDSMYGGNPTGFNFACSSTDSYSVKTDENGFFAFTEVPPRTRVELAVFSELYPDKHTWEGSKPKNFSISAGTEDVEVVLLPVSDIVCKVVDKGISMPVEGCKVFVCRRGENQKVPALWWSISTGTYSQGSNGIDSKEFITDKDGIFIAKGLLAGDYWILADPINNPGRQWVSDWLEVSAVKGKVADAMLYVSKPSIVNIQAVKEDGSVLKQRFTMYLKPAGDVKPFKMQSPPSVIRYMQDSPLPTQIDVNGKAKINLRPGVYAIERLAHKGLEPVDKEQVFEVFEGRTSDVVIRFKPKEVEAQIPVVKSIPEEVKSSARGTFDIRTGVMGKGQLSVSGVVTDEFGWPVVGIGIIAEKSGGEEKQKAQTDEFGRFKIDGFYEGKVTVMTEGNSARGTFKAGTSDIKILTVLGDDENAEYRRNKTVAKLEGGDVAFVVTDAKTGLPVEFDPDTGKKFPFISVTQENGTKTSIYPDVNGRVTVRLWPGKVELRAGRWPDYHTKSVELQIDKGEDITCKIAMERKICVSGKITDENGIAVFGAKLFVLPGMARGSSFTGGFYEVYWQESNYGSQVFDYYLVASEKKSGICNMVKIFPKDQNIDITLFPESSIVLKLKNTKGEAVFGSCHGVLRMDGTVINNDIEETRISRSHYVYENLIPPLENFFYSIDVDSQGYKSKRIVIKHGEMEFGKAKEIDVIFDEKR